MTHKFYILAVTLYTVFARLSWCLVLTALLHCLNVKYTHLPCLLVFGWVDNKALLSLDSK